MTKLHLGFLGGIGKVGTIVPGDQPGDEMVVLGLKKNAGVTVPREMRVDYIGQPPKLVENVDGRCVWASPGTVAIITRPDDPKKTPGLPTRVYLVPA